MSDRKNKLEGYLEQRETYPELQKPAPPTLLPKKKEYSAYKSYKGSEKADRFTLYDQEGDFDFYSYSHLIEGSCRKGILLLVTTTRSYTLTGQNMNKLAELVIDRKIRSFHAFNPESHLKQGNADEIVIEKIEREE